MTAAVTAARARYAECSETLRRHALYCHGSWWSPCQGRMSLRVDAASIAVDMLEAERLAGRQPRLWSREIPN